LVINQPSEFRAWKSGQLPALLVRHSEGT